jgi:parvulin-like peptidyl-prolyl isomerase
VNGQPITEEEIDKALAGPLAKLQEQIYTLRQQRLEAAIRDRLLAQEAERRGLSVSKLLDTEVMSKVGVVTEEEVEGFYQANKARIGNANEVEIRDRIRSGLQGQEIAVAREAFVQSLRKSATIDEGARLGVTGTPAFFINGELLSGPQPLESFVRVVERALAQAR